MKNARFTDASETVVEVETDEGERRFVPADPQNADWRALQAAAAAPTKPLKIGVHDARVGLGERRELRLTALADRRWRAEAAMVWLGKPFSLDATSRANLTAAVVGLQLPGAPKKRRWKLEGGERRDMNLSDLTALTLAAAAHVQACFDREETLAAAIAAAPDGKALAAIDIDAGWPETAAV